MGIPLRPALFLCLAGLTLSAQTLSNKSLNGKYFFREVLAASDSGQVQTAFGTITFDGNGGFAFAAQQLSGSSAPANASGNGTYAVQSGGLATLSDPLKSGATINARVATAALAGSNTESGNTFSIFIAAPAPAAAVNNATLSGTYWTASLEFLNGSVGFRRETFFSMTANGSGSFGSPNVLGEAGNLRDSQLRQAIAGVTYSVSADGTATVTFPIPGGGDATQQVIAGAKSLYVASDGSFFFGGGSAAGGQGLVIGIKAAPNATAANVTGLYFGADLRVEGQSYAAYAGSANALGDGRMVWSRRLAQSPSFVEDVTALTPYSVNPDASGSLLDYDFAVSSAGLFVGSGLSTSDTSRYELFFGARAPSVSGGGLFLNPQGVFNVFSFAPVGNPIAPGEFITIYGSGLPTANPVPVPFPVTLGGAQLMINNTPAPLYALTSTQVFAVVPYSIKGPSANIVLSTSSGQSNTVTVPVADSAPGIASVAQNGLGGGAVTHANGSLITAASPASRGETIVIYLTGLGAVTPSVKDGAAATGLSKTNSVLAVYVNTVCGNGPVCDGSNILYQGLTPGYAGLYQINVTIPMNVQPGAAVPLSIQTASGFTDLVDIAVQ